MILSETATNNVNWKFIWVPFDETTYLDVLDRIEPHDIILYIIAGNLRLDRRMVMTCCWIYALEIQDSILDLAYADEMGFPENLSVQY